MAPRLVSDSQIRRQTIGACLKAWRTNRHLTQKAVAEVLGYSTPQFVSNWERGVSLPPLNAMPVLAKLYALSQQEVILAYETCLQGLQKRQAETLRNLFAPKAAKERRQSSAAKA